MTEVRKRKSANGVDHHDGGSPGDETRQESWLVYHLNHTVVPILLMVTMPNLVILLWYTAVHCNGSYQKLCLHFAETGIQGLVDIWSNIHIASPFSLKVVGGFIIWSLILMKVVPGRRIEGPVTPKGNVPVYKDNGFSCYVITMLAFGGLTYYLKQHGMSTSIVYDKFDEILATLNVFSGVFCAMLYLKGISSPTTTDSGTSGNIIFDYYWGTELYPRIFGFDVKVFTNCRFGMTAWPLLVAVYAVKSYELHGFVDSMFVSVFIQFLYLSKFFWWEGGYMRTIDIMLDRAGFYICWGCLVYVPGLYAAVSMYLVNQPVRLGNELSALILVIGTLSVMVNYYADWQKQEVRRTDGNCLIWGKKPEIIRATYTLENGEKRHSILLVSGWWGVARHFHYLPEITLAFCWTVPALFSNIMPYSYWIFLVILLTHRSFRDDDKCSKKYGKYWEEYQKRVPNKIIPFIF